MVYNAGSEARAKGYTHLYVFGFEIEPNARKLVDEAEAAPGIPGTYVAATPDLVLGDLLKTMRSSQVFSVTGLPEVKVTRVDSRGRPLDAPPASLRGARSATKQSLGDEPPLYQVTLLGLDSFDPATMETDHKAGEMVPAGSSTPTTTPPAASGSAMRSFPGPALGTTSSASSGRSMKSRSGIISPAPRRPLAHARALKNEEPAIVSASWRL